MFAKLWLIVMPPPRLCYTGVKANTAPTFGLYAGFCSKSPDISEMYHRTDMEILRLRNEVVVKL